MTTFRPIGPLRVVVICRLAAPFTILPACRKVPLKQLGQSLGKSRFFVMWPEHQSTF